MLLLAGCSKQLLGALDETAANQVVSALRFEGVSADKANAGEKGWRVDVPDDQFAEAVRILERRNLPSHQFQGLGQVFKKESLVSTPTEERARLMYALSQELEHSLLEIDGVLAARVHPVILPQDPLNPKRSQASASVLVKYRAGTDVDSRESMVRGLVAAGIEGLRYDDVRVAMVPVEAHAPAIDTASRGHAATGLDAMARLRLTPSTSLGVALAVLSLLVGLAGWAVWRRPAGQTLRGRWEHTINSLYSERGSPRDTRGHAAP